MSIRERLVTLYESLGVNDIVAGSSEERVAAEKIRGYLEELRLEARVFEFEAMSWRERYVETCVGGLKVRSVAMPYVLNGEAEGKAVYVGSRILEEDWSSLNLEGKIALVKFYEKVDEAEWQYLQAVRAGAEAVVFMDSYPGRVRRMVLTLNTDYRFVEGTPPPIPAVSVSLEDGLRIKRLAESGEKVSVRVEAEVDHGARSRVVYAGDLSGPVFSAHIDKWLGGFRDNALGVGLVLYMAEKLRDKAGYIFFGAEESGAPGFSPWYWIWGSRRFAEFLEAHGLLGDFGLLLNVDVLGGKSIRISASTPDVQAGLSRVVGEEAMVCPDQVIFDSFSFTLKGVPSTTTHTFPEVLPVYHTDLDSPGSIDWFSVERASKILERIAIEFSSKREDLFEYNELLRSIASRLERVAFLPSVQGVLEQLDRLRISGEDEARQVRRSLTGPMFWGRYDRVFRDSEVFYPLYTDAIDDFLLVSDILSGGRDASEIVRLRGIRRIAGLERILPSVEPVFYGRVFSSPGFLREVYFVLERIVERDVEELWNKLEYLRK
ncbi:MAG: M28 family peptidase [Infirmifilum sp.]